MSPWSGYGLSVLLAIWLSWCRIVSGGSDPVASVSVSTPTLPSFQLASPAPQVSASIQPSIPPISLSPIPSTLKTLTSAPVSTAQNAVTGSPLSSLPSKPPMVVSSALSPNPVDVPPPSSQNHSESWYYGPERGPTIGNLTIWNNCKMPLYVLSVGSWPLEGWRDFQNKSVSWGTKQEDVIHPILAGENYTEGYRTTCALPLNKTEGYCWSEDKFAGQGIAMKISADEHNFSNILQFEYALVQNPARGDTYLRLDYDVSLLDCGNPAIYAKDYHVNVAPPPATGAAAVADAVYVASWRNMTELTDFTATSDDHKLKVDMCPGYQDGVTVTFPSAPVELCPPIRCDGTHMCKDIYTFDRTRPDEPSKACHAEYKGDMVVKLCAGPEGS